MSNITREEAIQVLKREKLSLDEKYYKAIDMAIEALEKLIYLESQIGGGAE